MLNISPTGQRLQNFGQVFWAGCISLQMSSTELSVAQSKLGSSSHTEAMLNGNKTEVRDDCIAGASKISDLILQ